jgi:hypothetical protein
MLNKNESLQPIIHDSISRAEAAKILAVAAGVPIPDSAQSDFADVDPNNNLTIYIRAAYDAKILSGQVVNGKRIFRPYDPLLRAELTKLIVNAF